MDQVNPADVHREFESPRGRALSLIVQASLLLGELVAAGWLIASIMSSDWVEAACLGQFILAMTAASAALYCAAKRRRQLYQPIHLLEKLIPDIRAGRAPIDDLSTVTGQLEPIARHIQELLREMRAQKSSLADLDHEIRQRIANRTEALERKIGSLTHQATRDALTGLLNRRALDAHLAKLIEGDDPLATPLSVLMIDVDYFKPLNDTLGHAAGDELLRSIGQIFRSTLREKDAAFRCGGDEFVIVLDGADLAAAKALGERLSATVNGLVKTLKVPNLPRLSIGAAALSEVTPHTAGALLKEADARLYAAKGSHKRGNGSPVTGKPPFKKSA